MYLLISGVALERCSTPVFVSCRTMNDMQGLSADPILGKQLTVKRK